MLKSKSYLNDIHLPYLKYALDEDIVRHYCQALLADKTDISIIGCRVVKLRHRRAKRSTIQYEMTLRVANGSPQTHWLVGYQFADAGKFRSVSRRFKKLCAGPEPVDGLPPGFVIEAIGLLLQRFPFDRHLPELSSLYFNLDPCQFLLI